MNLRLFFKAQSLRPVIIYFVWYSSRAITSAKNHERSLSHSVCWKPVRKRTVALFPPYCFTGFLDGPNPGSSPSQWRSPPTRRMDDRCALEIGSVKTVATTTLPETNSVESVVGRPKKCGKIFWKVFFATWDVAMGSFMIWCDGFGWPVIVIQVYVERCMDLGLD